MTLLVDTSILIDFLRGIENEGVEKFKLVLSNNVPFGINFFIYQELLQGTKTEKEYKLLKKYLDTQRFFDLKGRESYASAARIYFECRRKGITISSTIDCLIAQTVIENNLFLLHNDQEFDMISTVVPIKIM